MSGDDSICSGCGRTLDKIAQWISLSIDARKRVIQLATNRVSRLTAS